MASRIRTLTLKKVFSSSFPKLNRGYSQSSGSSRIEKVDSHQESKISNIVALESSFIAPDNPAIHRSYRTGSGFFVEPNLIVTCAHVVGRIANSYESKPAVEKPPEDRFQHGSILHKSYIANTVALTRDGAGTVKTTPLAVNFGNDVAVLRVVEPDEDNLFPPKPDVVSYSPSNKGEILFNFSMRGECAVLKTGRVRASGERTVTVKAPWPLDDKAKWLEIGSISIPHDPTQSARLGTITGALSSVGGSPWLNIVKLEDGRTKNQVVGISSWEVTWDDPELSPVSFAVPAVYINAILDYARTKTPEDPVVMDSWIHQIC